MDVSSLPLHIYLFPQRALNLVQKTPAKLAKIPQGTSIRKSWHVERLHVMGSVFAALNDGTGPRLVGLVGDSGAGKTTAASEIVRSTEVREAFSDGILWLAVDRCAKERLPWLMLQLARMVYEDIGSSLGPGPTHLDDEASYIKQFMDKGHGGGGLKCLVVADNVCEREVVSKLLETGMWVLLSTRDEELVTGEHGVPVWVDELSEADAKNVVRKAAELSPEVRLPDVVSDLIELCGRVAMELSFVGRWSTVRGRQDRIAWSDAVRRVRAEIDKIEGDTGNDIAEKTRTTRRRAIFQAGFEDLAGGLDDDRVQRLYLSLAVMPDGCGFTVQEAAVLLYDRAPNPEDEASVRLTVDILERWSVLRSEELASSSCGFYMHAAHSGFARESLMDRGNVLRPARARWVRYISALDTLRSAGTYRMTGLWLGVGDVGGAGWMASRPYGSALSTMDESHPTFWEYIDAVASFQQSHGDVEGMVSTCRRALAVEVSKLGSADGQGANTLYRLGAYVRGAGQLGEAEELMRRCLEIKEAKLGPDDLQVASTLCRLGEDVRDAGRLEEAGELLTRCLRIEEAKLGPEDLQVAHTLHELGVCARRAGRQEEAEELVRRCLVIRETKFQEVVSSSTGLDALTTGNAGALEEVQRAISAAASGRLSPDTQLGGTENRLELDRLVAMAADLDEIVVSNILQRRED